MQTGSSTLIPSYGASAAVGSTTNEVPVKPIQPGGGVCAVEEFTSKLLDADSCSHAATLNFVFQDDEGELYIGSVAHNFSGERNKARVPGEEDAFGKVVFDSDSADFAHPGSTPDGDALDFALIRIDEERYTDVEPRVRYWGGPTGHTKERDTEAPASVVAYSNHAAEIVPTEGDPKVREGQFVADSPEAFTSTVIEEGGDSGMPYLYGPTGLALGVNANCACGGLGYYPTVEYLLARLATHGWQLSVVTGALGRLSR